MNIFEEFYVLKSYSKNVLNPLFIECDISSGFQGKFKPKSFSEQFLSSALCMLKLRFHQRLNQYNHVVTSHRRKFASSSSSSSPQTVQTYPSVTLGNTFTSL